MIQLFFFSMCSLNHFCFRINQPSVTQHLQSRHSKQQSFQFSKWKFANKNLHFILTQNNWVLYKNNFIAFSFTLTTQKCVDVLFHSLNSKVNYMYSHSIIWELSKHNTHTPQWALIPKLSAPALRVRFDPRNVVLTHWRHLAVVLPLGFH
jgi:hypothetical protein